MRRASKVSSLSSLGAEQKEEVPPPVQTPGPQRFALNPAEVEQMRNAQNAPAKADVTFAACIACATVNWKSTNPDGTGQTICFIDSHANCEKCRGLSFRYPELFSFILHFRDASTLLQQRIQQANMEAMGVTVSEPTSEEPTPPAKQLNGAAKRK